MRQQNQPCQLPNSVPRQQQVFLAQFSRYDHGTDNGRMTDRQRQPSCIWTFRWANNNNSRTYSQARTSYCKLNGNLRIVKGYGCVSRRIAIRRTGLNGLRTNSAFVALKRNIVLSLPITMNVFASINTHIHTHTHTITSKFNNIILRISQVRLNLST